MAVAETLAVAEPQWGSAVFEETVERFLSTALAIHDKSALEGWRPLRRSLARSAQPLMAMQAGLQVHHCKLKDHQMCFWQGGRAAGQPLLLIHGFGASKENWVYITRKLGRRFRVIVPDLAGFGNSEFYPDADYRLAAQADRIAELCDQLGLGAAMVVGSSMGGGIAAQLAARHPAKVLALMLMNSAGAPARRLSLLEAGVAAGRNYLSPGNKAETIRTLQICLHRRHKLQAIVLGLLMGGEMAHRKPVNDFIFHQLVLSLEDTWNCIDGIQVPSFVLWGDSDQVLDPSCAEAFAQRLANAHAMVLPGCGHLPMLEEAGLCTQLISDFWTTVNR